MSRFRLEITLSEDQVARLDEARGFEPRASFVKRALEAALKPKVVLPSLELDARKIAESVMSEMDKPKTAAYVDQTAEMPKPMETAADWAMERQRKMNERREK